MGHWEKEGKTDEWYTPKYIFNAMDYIFDMDVCAPVDLSLIHTPCKASISKNSLDLTWRGVVWMNPPFGGRNGIIPWMDKIAAHGSGIALTPDRTSAKWWQIAAEQSDAHLFVRGKIKFINSLGFIGTKPGNGTTLFAYGDISVKILQTAEINGLGLCFKKFPK